MSRAGVGGPSERCADSTLGDEGVESPSTEVLGRKREAMMTLWCLSELIVVVDGEEGRASQKPRPIHLRGDDLLHR